MTNLKNYIGFSLDFSGSMQPIEKDAAKDYNNNISAIKEAAIANNQDTIVSMIKCGVGSPARNVRAILNSNVQVLQPIQPAEYKATGNRTPLFDSVGELIDIMLSAPDANDDMVSFLVMVITDGEDNSSTQYNGRSLSEKIRKLQSTDRWTFVFRVPRGAKRTLVSLGIPEGNILEWDQTSRGVEVASAQTTTALNSFYQSRSAGAKSSKTFYSDLSHVDSATVQAALTDISAEVTIWPVLPNEDGADIRGFCEKRLGKNPMLKGAALYQLTKTESKVQDYKVICIRDKNNSMIYSGAAARNLLGLPHHGDVRLAPRDHSHYEIFIQSTSVNRKLPAGSQVLYWPKIGTPFLEGPSAR